MAATRGVDWEWQLTVPPMDGSDWERPMCSDLTTQWQPENRRDSEKEAKVTAKGAFSHL